MNIHRYPISADANSAAAELLATWLVHPSTRNIMVAAGNTPLDLYALIASRSLNLSQLNVFALDEYVGVPEEEPRNCANLLKSAVAEAWRIPMSQYHTICSLPEKALASVRQHQEKILGHGGIDVLILGLGQNGHLGFNEPGSEPDSTERVLDLDPISVEANRLWFGGRYAPAQGVTAGMKTLLAARQVMVLAYGPHKSKAVRAMIEGEISSRCPASLLRHHPATHVFIDAAAASLLSPEA